jgi:hypothetical protein
LLLLQASLAAAAMAPVLQAVLQASLAGAAAAAAAAMAPVLRAWLAASVVVSSERDALAAADLMGLLYLMFAVTCLLLAAAGASASDT